MCVFVCTIRIIVIREACGQLVPGVSKAIFLTGKAKRYTTTQTSAHTHTVDIRMCALLFVSRWISLTVSTDCTWVCIEYYAIFAASNKSIRRREAAACSQLDLRYSCQCNRWAVVCVCLSCGGDDVRLHKHYTTLSRLSSLGHSVVGWVWDLCCVMMSWHVLHTWAPVAWWPLHTTRGARWTYRIRHRSCEMFVLVCSGKITSSTAHNHQIDL